MFISTHPYRLKLLKRVLERQTFYSQDFTQSRRNINRAGTFLRPPRGVHGRRLDVFGVPAELLTPANLDSPRHILYLHGGAFVSGGIASHRGLAGRIARLADAQVLLIDYRLAPEQPYPAAIEDTHSAYNWLLEQGVTEAQIGLAGDASGANLALRLMQDLKRDDKPLPACAAFLCPWLDLTCSGESMTADNGQHPLISTGDLSKLAQMYATHHDLASPEISPLFGDLSGLPRILVQAGAEDPLRDDAIRFAEMAREAGTSVSFEMWADMFHDWHLFAPFLEDGRWALNRVSYFLKIHSAKH
ncbi:MAG: alpha/beta hydrolase [Pseudomonadota bacterium]|nr:alpha/beta hydrolase [Pseudomonadota bacterium]